MQGEVWGQNDGMLDARSQILRWSCEERAGRRGKRCWRARRGKRVLALLPSKMALTQGRLAEARLTLGYITQPFQGWCIAEWWMRRGATRPTVLASLRDARESWNGDAWKRGVSLRSTASLQAGMALPSVGGRGRSAFHCSMDGERFLVPANVADPKFGTRSSISLPALR